MANDAVVTDSSFQQHILQVRVKEFRDGILMCTFTFTHVKTREYSQNMDMYAAVYFARTCGHTHPNTHFFSSWGPHIGMHLLNKVHLRPSIRVEIKYGARYSSSRLLLFISLYWRQRRLGIDGRLSLPPTLPHAVPQFYTPLRSPPPGIPSPHTRNPYIPHTSMPHSTHPYSWNDALGKCWVFREREGGIGSYARNRMCWFENSVWNKIYREDMWSVGMMYIPLYYR